MKFLPAFFLFLLGLQAIPAQAQKYYDIIGLVLDSATQKPVVSATVQILKTKIKTTTDENGAFDILDIRQGKYRLLIAREGYDSLIVPIQLDKDLRQTFFVLKSVPPAPPEVPTVDTTLKDTMPVYPFVPEPVKKKKNRKEVKPDDSKYSETLIPSDTAIQDLIAQLVDYKEIYLDEIEWNKKEKHWEVTGFFVVESLGLYEFEAELIPASEVGLILKEFEAEKAKVKK